MTKIRISEKIEEIEKDTINFIKDIKKFLKLK